MGIWRRAFLHKAFVLSLLLSVTVLADAAANDAGSATDVYPKEFFEEFSPITAADMLDRVPGISFILENGVTSNRGFGTNQDRILINGRRVSGKESNGREALQRIAADQVERIEVFRTGSSDADNRTSDTQVNIVLKEDDGGTTATWEFSYTRNQGNVWRPGGKFTFASGWKIIDFALALEGEPQTEVRRQTEDAFSAANRLFEHELGEEFKQQTNLSVSGDATFSFSDDTVLRINGIYADKSQDEDTNGVFFLAPSPGTFVFDRQDFEDDEIAETKWEVGGDYEHAFGSGSVFKLLGLHNVTTKDREKLSGDVVAGAPITSEILLTESRDTETILRGAFNWPVTKNQNLEMGIEGARNTLDSDLQIFRDMGGGFVEVNLPLSQSFVKELRAEAFIVDTWQATDRLNLETGLFYEISEISQSGSGLNQSRTLKFFKPTFLARYALTKRDQLQLSVEREVGQLNFLDFVASVNDAIDQLNSGNPAIVPDKTWAVEVIWDHQLKDNKSSIRSRVFYDFVQDVVGKTALPGATTDFTGNIGDGNRYGFEVEVALALDRFGVSGAIVEAGYYKQWSNSTDPFTGATVPFRFERHHNIDLELRHDVAPLNIFYGITYSKDGPTDVNEFSEIRSFRFGGKLGAFIEYRLPWGWTVRFDGTDLFDSGSVRTRELFGGRRGLAALQSILRRERLLGREFKLSIRGRF